MLFIAPRQFGWLLEALRSHSTVRSHVFRKLFMESVLLKANLINLSTGQYWLKFDGKKGMLDREGHGHKAVLYKSHFPPLRHSLLERHRCIHRLINHVYTKGTNTFVIHCPTTLMIPFVNSVLFCDSFDGVASISPGKHPLFLKVIFSRDIDFVSSLFLLLSDIKKFKCLNVKYHIGINNYAMNRPHPPRNEKFIPKVMRLFQSAFKQ